MGSERYEQVGAIEPVAYVEVLYSIGHISTVPQRPQDLVRLFAIFTGRAF